MDSEYKLIIPYSDSNQYGSKPGISGIQENELSIIKDYERKLDNALNLSWAPKNSLTMDDFDDISGIRECFDDRRYLRENPPIIEAINKGLVSSAWDHWLQYGRIQRRFAKFDLPFEVLNDRNFNKDIFIFLDRNELHQLDNLAQIYLRSKTTLDFADFNMEAPPSYIIVSNLRDQMIAAKMAPPETSIICLRPVEDPTGTLLTLTIPHIDINIDNILKKRGLPRYLTGPKAPLYGKSEFISAIHFGFISGSSRIILVGNNSEQDDATDENKYLSEIISIIKKQGVEIFSTCKNSLNHRSGARFLSLADIIKEEQHKYSGNGKNYIINDGYSLSQKSLFITKASDSWITDEKGKHYLDTGMAAGSAILGHANKRTEVAILKAIEKGALFGKPTPPGIELGSRLHGAFPWYSGFALCSTGSEATMRLIRIARSYTKRKKIALFAGAWHGTHDFLLIDDRAPHKDSQTIPFMRSRGSPDELLDLVILLPYNQQEALNIIQDRKQEIAAVFTEPIQGSNPRESDVDFMRQLRKVTEECDILLAFDEIITGGRLSLGGFQQRYDIHADLASYGKIFGGGLPFGFVGGVEEIMQTINDPGVRGAVKSESRPVILGGTFTGNPITVAAANAVLAHLEEHGEEIYEHIDSGGERIRNEVNSFCVENTIKARMYGIGSICRLIFSDQLITSARDRDKFEPPKDIQERFYNRLLEKQIYIAGNRLMFISATHTHDEVTMLINEIKATLAELKSENLL